VRERGDERQKVERLSLNVPIESCGRMQSGSRVAERINGGKAMCRVVRRFGNRGKAR
jgi:hypothetical protein